MYCFRPQMSGVAFTVSMVGGGGGRRVEILAVTHAGPPDCCSGDPANQSNGSASRSNKGGSRVRLPRDCPWLSLAAAAS